MPAYHEPWQPIEDLAKLRARVAQLESRNSQNLESWSSDIREHVKQRELLLAENQRLSAENSGLRADAERLDWLAANPRAVIYLACGLYTAGGWTFDNIREAIDAARSGK